jgi:hypothetical protein
MSKKQQPPKEQIPPAIAAAIRAASFPQGADRHYKKDSPEIPEGYQRVYEGEIQEGDKFWVDDHKLWVTARTSVGSKINPLRRYIRRIQTDEDEGSNTD